MSNHYPVRARPDSGAHPVPGGSGLLDRFMPGRALDKQMIREANQAQLEVFRVECAGHVARAGLEEMGSVGKTAIAHTMDVADFGETCSKVVAPRYQGLIDGQVVLTASLLAEGQRAFGQKLFGLGG